MARILVLRVRKWNKRLVIALTREDVQALGLQAGGYVNVSAAFSPASKQLEASSDDSCQGERGEEL